MNEKPKAFVIMPFDPEFNSIYEQLIKPSLEEAGYFVARADDFQDQQNILSDIVRGITTAQLVVADLTSNNPNIFYELGLCHGLRVPTILLAQSIDEVPFDLRSYKIQIYETHFNKIHKLKDALKSIGEKHNRGEILFGSPVTDFSIGKHEPSEIIEETFPIDVEETVEDSEEKGILDFLAEGEEASNDLTKFLSKMMKDNAQVTTKIQKHTASINALAANPGAGTAGKFRKVSLLAASDMNAFSKKVEDILPLFEETVEKFGDNFSGYVNLFEVKGEEEQRQLENFQESVKALLEGTREAGNGMRSYRDTVAALRTYNIGKELNRASRRQAQVLDSIVLNIERIEAFCVKILGIINEKIGNSGALPILRLGTQPVIQERLSSDSE
jgi:hypothetical protein